VATVSLACAGVAQSAPIRTPPAPKRIAALGALGSKGHCIQRMPFNAPADDTRPYTSVFIEAAVASDLLDPLALSEHEAGYRTTAVLLMFRCIGMKMPTLLRACLRPVEAVMRRAVERTVTRGFRCGSDADHALPRHDAVASDAPPRPIQVGRVGRCALVMAAVIVARSLLNARE
jgi:hypothetical protein